MTKKKSFFERLTGSIKMDDAYTDEDLYAEDASPEVYDDEPVEGQLSVDVIETSSAVIIQAMTAGVNKNDLEITISRETVEIRGERHMDRFSHDAEYITQELYWGAFSRIVDLPDEIEVEEASAKEEHGLLTIFLPKIDKHKQAKLKVS